MTIKEKAQRYDEIIDRARKEYKNHEAFKGFREMLERIFPELKESESEKIRKLLIGGLELHGNEIFAQGELDMILDWFEKQGEQVSLPKWKYKSDNNPLLRDSIILNKYGCVAKSPSGALVSGVWVIDYDDLAKLPKEGEKQEGRAADKEPKFKAGDWIISDYDNVAYIESISETKYNLQCKDGHHEKMSVEYIDRNWHKWTIQDAKDGDVLLSPSTPEGDKECPFIFKEIDKNGIVRFHAALLQNEELKIADGITNVIGYANAKYHIPATKEQRDLLFEKMEEAGYMWDSKNKEVQKIKQKPANNQFTPEQADVLDKHIDKFLEQKQNTSTQINNPSEYINDMGGNGCYLKNTVQSSAWSDEDEYVFNKVLNWVLIVNPTSSIFEKLPKEQFIERFKSIRPQINVTDEELAQAKKEAYNNALDKIEYHSGEPTFDDGWSAAIWYLKKRNAQPQSQWKPSDEQMEALLYEVNAWDEDSVNGQNLKSLYQDLKKLRKNNIN